ncbi:RNA pseudouridine synthase 6, chloroplastic [Porphyridium purpureum]|uniref:RNA pseudouridine synthase 6, chloroplastic n=1 Tax=Porphyridium purpureum TaxID=35688 RepID=A0A5J4YPY1_PORPP|nr:RNA pseudouridine synthase 6, chloroplastic [Porphyridium purpureum]|eukprot:POR5981..scf222_8
MVDVFSSSFGQKMPMTLYPVSAQVRYPPMNFHMATTHEGHKMLSHVIAEHTQLPHAYVLDLIAFGAVHISEQERVDAVAMRTRREIVRTVRQRTDMPILAERYIRVHASPKRFPVATLIDWTARILYRSEVFVVVDKPPGLLCMPSVDNWVENAKYQVERVLGMDGNTSSLHVCTRLDRGTSGVCLMAMGPEQHAKMQAELVKENGSVRKVYKVLTRAPLPLGIVEHAALNYRANKRAKPGPLYEVWSDSDQLWARTNRNRGQEFVPVKMEILDCAELSLGPNARASNHDCAERGAVYFESTVRLITGRTHQIRRQCAALNAPLVSDCMYEPIAGVILQVKAHEDASTNRVLDGPSKAEVSQEQSIHVLGPEPERLGLVAERVEFAIEGVEHVFTTDHLWWRSESIDSVPK